MKTETWNGHNIRFVEKDGEWWAVAADVCAALELTQVTRALSRIWAEDKALISIKGISRGNDRVNILSEFGIYDMAFASRKAEAREFKRWAFDIIKTLRQASGLEGFQIFRMLDKRHQVEAMERLNEGLRKPVRVDFIKANTIANKAVSNKHGYPRMVKKEAMTPEMLVDRQSLLDDTVELMALNDKFGLGLSISDQIYARVAGADRQAG